MMLKSGFLRFCDNPEIACCKAERELEQLRTENASLREQLAESQRREQAAVEDLKRFSACCQCNANIDGSCCDMFDGTAENKYFCSSWQWRGPQEDGNENI